MWDQHHEIATFIRNAIPVSPQVGIILGTGLGGLANEIDSLIILPYSEIPNFPRTTVQGHDGRIIIGALGGKIIIAFQGRFHFYEGYSMEKIILPVRIMHRLGIRLLILSNASGGLNPEFEIGDRMIVTDHINLMPSNPFIGYPNFRSEVLPDMSEVYDHRIVSHALKVARQIQIPMRRGILAAVSGPCFETKAEYAYIRILGADAVGMSIIPEALAAHQLRLPVFAVSVISDLGIAGKIVEVSHEDVQLAAARSEPLLTKLIKNLVTELDFSSP
jgi:purine-nucleoside phosphorylase